MQIPCTSAAKMLLNAYTIARFYEFLQSLYKFDGIFWPFFKRESGSGMIHRVRKIHSRNESWKFFYTVLINEGHKSIWDFDMCVSMRLIMVPCQ